MISEPVLMQMRCQQLLLHRSSRHDRDALHFLLNGNQRNSSPQLIAASGTVLYNISAKPEVHNFGRYGLCDCESSGKRERPELTVMKLPSGSP